MTPAEFDGSIFTQTGAGALIGIDEAGRGPLAGPVVACACLVLPGPRLLPEGINDSKKLSPARREELFALMQQCGVRFGLGQADNREIDAHNILQATFIAMRRAVAALGPLPDNVHVLVDGNKTVPLLNVAQRAVVKGDSQSLAIAAASIMAKVTRDRFLVELDRTYPQYGFAGHKGYPTKEHYQAIACHGITPFHRRSFLKNITLPQQLELWG